MSNQEYEELRMRAHPRRTKVHAESNVFSITVKQALKDPTKSLPAIEAIDHELLQMVQMEVFHPIYRHEEAGLKKPIRSHMFLREKYDAEGTFEKLKARLVGGGDMQSRNEVLHEDVSSPTAAMPFMLCVGSIAAKEKRHVVTADVPSAYLHADNSRHGITMTLDPIMAKRLVVIKPEWGGYVRSDATMVVVLTKAIYGCIESARLWYNMLTNILIQHGYKANPLEPCIMNKIEDGIQCTIIIYVDDLMFTCINQSMMDSTITHLENHLDCSLKVKSGPIHSYLGLMWDYSEEGKCKVTMDGYINDLLKGAGITGSIGSPASDNLFTVRADAPKLDKQQISEYHTLTAKLLYAAKRARPDILLPVSFLSTRVQSPDTDDLSKLHRVLRYLNSCPNIGIILECDNKVSIQSYIDASYGVHADYRSHTGMVIMLGHGPIDIASTKQRINTKSSAEAEFVGVSDKATRAIWCSEFLQGQGYDKQPATIFQDNTSTIRLATNGVGSSDRTRHVAIRHFWLKDRSESGDIEIVYKPTTEMIADILTKPLHGDIFIRLRNLLMNWHV
jgi:hypothetical protein